MTDEATDTRRATAKTFHFKKRDKGIADMSNDSMSVGDITLDDLVKKSIWKVNSLQLMGIATQNEVGLEPDRWPVFVRLLAPGEAVPAYDTAVDTVMRFWEVVSGTGAKIAFTVKPTFREDVIERIYKYFPDLDKEWFSIFNTISARLVTGAAPDNLQALMNKIYDGMKVPIPTAEMITTVKTDYTAYVAACVAANRLPVLRLDEDVYVRARPHGANNRAVVGVDAGSIPQLEACVTAILNFQRIDKRHPTLKPGVKTMCAYIIANMARYGNYETHANQEYYMCYVNRVTTTVTPPAVTAADGTVTQPPAVVTYTNQYAVAGITGPPGAPPCPDLAIGQTIDASTMKVSMSKAEIANGFIAIAGMMHYSYNHTTGGPIVTGPLASLALSYHVIEDKASDDVLMGYTSALYEALHPTNKRHLANIMFPNCKVYTAGRSRSANRMVEIEYDSYISIRRNPAPAGAHKAFVGAEVMKRVLASHIAPFLPWAAQMNTFIGLCTEVASAGARAHVGARYYTGDAPRTQGANIDAYLPELAYFIQTMARMDTLALSPHLSTSVAARADANWQSLVKNLKQNDLSSTNVEVVREYLVTAGRVTSTLDPANKETWARSQTECNNALNALRMSFA